MSRLLKAAALALTLAALPAVGDAQTADNRAPIMWSAVTVEYVGDTLTLRGPAELVQGDNRFRADQIAGFSQSGDSRLEATGNVYFVTPEQTRDLPPRQGQADVLDHGPAAKGLADMLHHQAFGRPCGDLGGGVRHAHFAEPPCPV